jgi:hypothetical protein
VFEPGQHREGGRIQDDRFRAGLAVGEQQHSAFEVHMPPFEFQDFPQPCAGEDQQADGRCGKRVDNRPAVRLLRRVLRGGLRVIDFPRQSHCLGFPDGIPELGEFIACQEALAPLLGVLVDTARGIEPVRQELSLAGERVQAANHCKHAVRLIGAILHAEMQARHVRDGAFPPCRVPSSGSTIRSRISR